MFEILTRAEVMQDLNVALAILIIGFIFFAYKSQVRIFYLGASAINMFIAVTYIDYMELFLPFLGISIILFVVTFIGGDKS